MIIDPYFTKKPLHPDFLKYKAVHAKYQLWIESDT